MFFFWFRLKGECADPPVDIPAVETIVHEGYIADSKAQGNDIALVRLTRSAPYTDFIRPVCLPIDPNLRAKKYDNQPLIVAGFGKTETSRCPRKLFNPKQAEKLCKLFFFCRVTKRSEIASRTEWI